MRILFLIVLGLLVFSGCKKEAQVYKAEDIDVQMKQEEELKKQADLSAALPPEPVLSDQKEDKQP